MKIDGKFIRLRSLERGRRIHFQAAGTGIKFDIKFLNSLVDMYAKCGSMVEARRVFESMPGHNLASWTALMLGYTENWEPEVALDLFFTVMQPQARAAADALTYVAALKACSSMAVKEQGRRISGKLMKICSLEKGVAIHSQAAEKRCELNVFVASSLVDMYAKCGSLENAWSVFEKMEQRDVVLWNALIRGYVGNGMEDMGLKLFARMQAECPPDPPSFITAVNACIEISAKEESVEIDRRFVKLRSLENSMAVHSQACQAGCDSDMSLTSSLIHMYAKCGSMVDSRRVFDRAEHRSMATWTALLLGYAENGEEELALQLFVDMRLEGFVPDAQTFVAVLKSCTDLEALKVIHEDICRCGLESSGILANSLVDAYGKCASIAQAHHIFDCLSERDTITWNALLAGYSRQGDTDSLFRLFHRMSEEGFQPDGITFISLLSACSHGGLISEGLHYFESMNSSRYGLTPMREHYVCVIDMLGRSNRLEAAVEMAQNMPFKADVLTWRTVLSSCLKWKNLAVGKFAFESLLAVDDSDPAAYKLMANIYGSTGMWEEQLQTDILGARAADRTWSNRL